MQYNEANLEKDFVPTNLRLGPTLQLAIDDYNTLAFSVDLNKLLVPTPPVYATDPETGAIIFENGEPVIAAGKDDNVGPVQGIIQSFYDAPGGFSEELKELAELRVKQPSKSLQELADSLKVSKSCLNHRMRKLMELANKE
jgi:hypothetical protein